MNELNNFGSSDMHPYFALLSGV